MISPQTLKELNESLCKLLEHKVFVDPKEEDLSDAAQYFSFLRLMIETECELRRIRRVIGNKFQICTQCGSNDHVYYRCDSDYCTRCLQFGHYEWWDACSDDETKCKRCGVGHAGWPCEDL
jgi:hypothetical protein